MSDRPTEVGGDAAPPPPAPPLPPQPSSARIAANAIARFAQNINYGTRGSTTAPHGGLQRPPPPTVGLSIERSSRSGFEVSSSSNQDLLLHQNLPWGLPGKAALIAPEIDRTTADRHRSPVSSRTVSHKTGIQIVSLDISPCRTRAVLAGRGILKTLVVTGSTCSEDYNLREKIVRYAATHEPAIGRVSAMHKDQLAANDVKWSHGDYHTTIATAAANGQIVVYDLNRTGVELARLHEHTRQVHKLGFNPHRGNLLLSGSQDGTTRLWDLRALAGERSVMTCRSKNKYAGNSEGIRDLRWSPTNGVEFAIGTDSGVIQRWDIRKESSPSLKVNAHEKTCNAVDWHPDGKYIVSGSADKTAKVWDFSSSDRRMKPSWQVRGPQAALDVRWRPASGSLDDQKNWHCTQLAVSYDEKQPRIHIWDLRRPSTPSRVVERYDTPPTAILWRSEDLLWSVDLAGTFTQTDVRFAPNPVDSYNVNPFSIAPDGRVMVASLKRERKRLAIDDVTDNLLRIERRDEANKSGRNSTAHSSTPGSHEEPSLLSSTVKNRRGKAVAPLKSSRSIDSTPPSTGPDDAVAPLDQSLQEKFMFKNRQLLAVGQIPGVMDTEAFKFMARNYMPPPEMDATNRSFDLHLVLKNSFRHNARVAAHAGQHRLAQTWKILAQAVERELGQRAERNYLSRIAALRLGEQALSHQSDLKAGDLDAGNTKHPDMETTDATAQTANSTTQKQSDISTTQAELLQDSQQSVESSHEDANLGQQPSPPASSGSAKGKQADRTPAVASTSPKPSGHDELMEKNLSINTKSAKPSIPNDEHLDSSAPSSSTKPPPGLGWDELDRQIAERRAAMGEYRALPRPVLKFDEPFRRVEAGMSRPAEGGINIPKSSRNDSNVGFQMFSASADSSAKTKSEEGSFDEDKEPDFTGSTMEDYYERQQIRKLQEKGEAERAMEFEDEADLVATQRSPASPGASKNPKNEKKGGNEHPKAATPLMPSVKAPDHVTQIIEYGDFAPSPNKEQPPKDETISLGHKYIESDFYDTTEALEDGTAPEFPPWTATAMFLPIIEYHCQFLSDSQFPTYLILYLGPWLYVNMTFDRAAGIISTYHERLMALELYIQAAEIRLYCERDFPQISSYGSKGITTGGPWCTNCNKASKGKKPGYCERCEKKWADCTVCHGHGYAAFLRSLAMTKGTPENPLASVPKAAGNLWSWCQRCGHGGHAGCLQGFWDFTDEGACPAEGCICDCIPGKARDRIHEKLKEEWKKAGPVAKDGWNVKESGAVQRTRSMVGGGGGGAPEAGRSILQGGRGGAGKGDAGPSGPQTLGATGRSASGGKKMVRIIEPDEENGGPSKGKGKGKEKEKEKEK